MPLQLEVTYYALVLDNHIRVKPRGRDGLELQKGKNKEWLLSKSTPNYMTPSLYFCYRLRGYIHNNRQRYYRDDVM